MQARNPRLVLMSMATAAFCGVLAAAPIQAADPACKGLEQPQCASTDGCAWTDDYTRKDGKTVAGYCHRIGKQGTAAKAPEQAPPATKVPPAGKAPELTPPPVKVPPAGKAAEPLPPVKVPAATSTGTLPATAPKTP